MEYNDRNNTIAYSITSTIFRHGTIPDDTACFQSRDAKSCVSTGEDALFIEMLECLALPHFLLGRRKILRLYWGGCAIY